MCWLLTAIPRLDAGHDPAARNCRLDGWERGGGAGQSSPSPMQCGVELSGWVCTTRTSHLWHAHSEMEVRGMCRWVRPPHY